MDSTVERRFVTLYTSSQRIEGEIHLPRRTRVSDRLNQACEFVPLTNVSVYTLNGHLQFTRSALMVNKAFVVALDDEALVPIDPSLVGTALESIKTLVADDR